MNTLGNIVVALLCAWFGGIIALAAVKHFRAGRARIKNGPAGHGRTATRPIRFGTRDAIELGILRRMK